MKKMIIGFMSVLMVVILTGCSVLSEITGAVGTDSKELYSTLQSLSSSPNLLENTYNNWLDKKITFTASVWSEVFEMESDDEVLNGQNYIYAGLSRTNSKYFYLNVNNVELDFEEDDVIVITGKIDGWIYETIDNKEVESLNIIAEKITIAVGSDVSPTTGNQFETKDYSIDVLNHSVVEGSFGPEVIVYYNYTNHTKSRAVSPFHDFIDLYQNGEYLENSIFSVDGLEEDALASTEFAEPGTSRKYYAKFQLVNSEDAVTLKVFDDEFNMLHSLDLQLQ